MSYLDPPFKIFNKDDDNDNDNDNVNHDNNDDVHIMMKFMRVCVSRWMC